MNNDDNNTFHLSSDKNDRVKIKEALYEIVGAYSFIDDKREYIKDVLDDLKNRYKIPKKYASKLARGLHKNKISEKYFKTFVRINIIIKRAIPSA